MSQPVVGVPQERIAENSAKGILAENLRGAEDEVFDRVLGETIDALENSRVPYSLIGGIAATGFGRPRWTHDIDVFVRPEDAERTLEILAEIGFSTEKVDHTWLFKGYRDRVMVDVIFRSAGGIYFDTEMFERSVQMSFRGRQVRLLPPEDLLIIKAVVHNETGPRHWHDALGILTRTELDWEYLLRRAHQAPRRVLSLLVYAHSLDLLVPNWVIRRLFEQIYSE